MSPDAPNAGGVVRDISRAALKHYSAEDRIRVVLDGLRGDPRRVVAGTDCGFDTSAERGRVAEDVVWAKLAAMVEGVRLASRRLGMEH
jgi:5-methyltetrahydropteroyltriglutamate--homocysteine methyltransferase